MYINACCTLSVPRGIFESVNLVTDLAQDGIPLLQVWYGVSQEMYGTLPITDTLHTVSALYHGIMLQHYWAQFHGAYLRRRSGR